MSNKIPDLREKYLCFEDYFKDTSFYIKYYIIDSTSENEILITLKKKVEKYFLYIKKIKNIKFEDLSNIFANSELAKNK